MVDDDKLVIPRPAPDEATIIIRDADGACAWVTGKKSGFDGVNIAQLFPLLAEGQQHLRDHGQAKETG